MGLFGKKEPKTCDICGKQDTANMHKATDGVICHECLLKTWHKPGEIYIKQSIKIFKIDMKNKADLMANNAVEMTYMQGLPKSLLGLGSVGKTREELIVKTEDYSRNKPIDACAFNTYRIPLDRVLSIDLITQENIKEKNKSVIGRGIVGGMLFGGVGAMLAGMSGIGTKVEVTNTILFVIAYTNAEGEIENIIFNPEKNLFNAEQFVLRFKQDREAEKVYQTNETGDILL